MSCNSCGREVPQGSLYCPWCGRSLMASPRRLFRSPSERQLLGVCGGLAEYFQVDPTLVRAAYLVLTVFTGFLPGLLAYFLLALIMPTR